LKEREREKEKEKDRASNDLVKIIQVCISTDSASFEIKWLVTKTQISAKKRSKSPMTSKADVIVDYILIKKSIKV